MTSECAWGRFAGCVRVNTADSAKECVSSTVKNKKNTIKASWHISQRQTSVYNFLERGVVSVQACNRVCYKTVDDCR